jgi:signal transduction histidine kinase
MTLRVRLILTILAVAIPVTPTLLWLAARQERLSTEKSVSGYALSMMKEWGRAACLKRPESFSGGVAPMRAFMSSDFAKAAVSRTALIQPSRLLGPVEMWTSDEVWAYRSSFAADNKRAPPFPPGLRKALESGDEVASEPTTIEGDSREHLAVAIRTPWSDEPCAILLVIHSTPPRPDLAIDRIWFGIAQTLVLLVAVLLACLPIVRKIAALKDAVRKSAASHYALPIRSDSHDEIGALARAFDEAGVEIRKHLTLLEKREETLRSFIANTTHDVMLPVTVLQGHLSEIKRRVDEGEAIDPQALIACHRETDYLTSILQNLTAVAKLEGADYQRRTDRLSLDELVSRVVARYRPIAQIEGVSLDHSVPAEDLEVVGDVTLLEQAVGNVIHNAIRYNRSGGHVAVLLDAAAGGRFSLRVIDDGPGIPEPDLARLTERRFRGDAARTRNPAGLGLGLHIVREVAAQHGFALQIRRSEYAGLEVELSGALAEAPVASGLADART